MTQKKMIFLIMDVKVAFYNYLKLPDGTVKVLVEGISRVKINEFQDNNEFLSCSYEKLK